MARILLVEDDDTLGKTLTAGLTAAGKQVTWATSGEDAFFRANAESFDVILLDWMLPNRSGIEVLRALRKGGFQLPILLLTARDDVDSRVEGLDSGADDYLVKPFAFPELLARVRALLRRGSRPEAGEGPPARRSLADLEMDLLTRKVVRAGISIDLTQREFGLLEYLLRHQGQIVSREMLAKDVWQETQRATSLDNVIDVHIARLRRKVDAEHALRLIHTVRGVGFILREEPL